jgi:hypothetical protein
MNAKLSFVSYIMFISCTFITISAQAAQPKPIAPAPTKTQPKAPVVTGFSYMRTADGD